MNGINRKARRAAARRPRSGRWTHADEDALQLGELRHNVWPHGPNHPTISYVDGVASDGCSLCSMVRVAERRRQTIEEMLRTVPPEFGGTLTESAEEASDRRRLGPS